MKVFRFLGLMAMVALLVGCHSNRTEECQVGNAIVKTGSYGTLYSVEFEGHKYVIYQDLYKGNVLHHPDCPCQSNKQ